jgi:hypothetical protein
MYRFALILVLPVFLAACASGPKTLDTAVAWGDAASVQQMLRNGANPNGVDDDHGMPHLLYAAASHRPEREQIIRALLEAGADPNLRGNFGRTPLHAAASAEAVNALLEYGADPALQDDDGALAVDWMERALISLRAAASNAEKTYADPAVNAHFEASIQHREAALQALGHTPITEEQAWEKYPTMMAALYPGGITPPPDAASATGGGASGPIQNNSGRYLSPYTSDGVVAEWVNKAINNQMGSAAGSAVGGAAGAYAANKALENVPGGSLLGGFLGSKAGRAVGNRVADNASGGDAYRRQTSDLSFHHLDNMAAWLVATHGSRADFAEVVDAASAVYPGLRDAIKR